MKEMKYYLKIFALYITALMWMMINLTVVLVFNETLPGHIAGLFTLMFFFFISTLMGGYYILEKGKTRVASSKEGKDGR